MKATFVKNLEEGFTGVAKLFMVDPPMQYDIPWDDDGPPAKETSFVVVSATVVPYGFGPETYIFPADENGNVISWGELKGSYKGGLSHKTALHRAGYTV